MLPFAVCRLTIGVTTKKKTRCIGYTRIGYRTGRRVFFERIETDDVTTVITQRDDSAAVICLHRKPHTKSREKKAGYQPAQQTKEEKKEGRKRNLPPQKKQGDREVALNLI